MKERNYNILVNPWHSLSAFYTPNDLVTIENTRHYHFFSMQISRVAYESFLMLKDIADKKLDIDLCINSAYRSYWEQKALWEYRKMRKGLEFTQKTVAVPGTSEHQTGLGIDIGKKVNGISINPTPKEYEAIRRIAKDCSLILRYPANPINPNEKNEKTGYIYEPWHFRFLDKDLVDYLFETNLTLEEYYEKEQPKQYTKKM